MPRLAPMMRTVAIYSFPRISGAAEGAYVVVPVGHDHQAVSRSRFVEQPCFRATLALYISLSARIKLWALAGTSRCHMLQSANHLDGAHSRKDSQRRTHDMSLLAHSTFSMSRILRSCRSGTRARRYVEVLIGGTSAAPRRLDRSDVDLLHAQHRIKRALCFITAGRHRLNQHAWRDLPG